MQIGVLISKCFDNWMTHHRLFEFRPLCFSRGSTNQVNTSLPSSSSPGPPSPSTPSQPQQPPSLRPADLCVPLSSLSEFCSFQLRKPPASYPAPSPLQFLL